MRCTERGPYCLTTGLRGMGLQPFCYTAAVVSIALREEVYHLFLHHRNGAVRLATMFLIRSSRSQSSCVR